MITGFGVLWDSCVYIYVLLWLICFCLFFFLLFFFSFFLLLTLIHLFYIVNSVPSPFPPLPSCTTPIYPLLIHSFSIQKPAGFPWQSRHIMLRQDLAPLPCIYAEQGNPARRTVSKKPAKLQGHIVISPLGALQADQDTKLSDTCREPRSISCSLTKWWCRVYELPQTQVRLLRLWEKGGFGGKVGLVYYRIQFRGAGEICLQDSCLLIS